MADARYHDSLLPLLTASHRSRRKAGATLLRYAIDAAIVAIIEPLALDNVAILVEPDTLGVTLDSDGHVANIWIGPVETQPGPISFRSVGALCAGLLEPVAIAARATTGLGTRRADYSILDALQAEGARLERLAHVPPESEWIIELKAGTGLRAPTALRSIEVRPDAGPPFELFLPRGCCAGTRALPADACPTCPLHSDDTTRRSATEEWLRTLTPADFVYVVGRARSERVSLGWTGPAQVAATNCIADSDGVA
ncbi:MAG: hypothetical protein FJW94_14270 [Actinobacteria bacterium]|nr:hypothetical protein [Actinomycetota bacterium]